MSTIAAITDAWDKETGDGRDEAGVRKSAAAYVKAHPEEFIDLKDITEAQAIALIDVYRQVPLPDQVDRVQVFMWATFAKRHIGIDPVNLTVEVQG